MNSAGVLELATRQLVVRGTQAAGLMAGSLRAALGALSHTATTIAQPASLRGLALEAGAVAVHLVMYPWGALTDQLCPGGPYGCHRADDLSPAERGLGIADVVSATTPILLVHGFAGNRTAFAVLARTLRKHGFGVVYCLNYNLLTALTGDVRSAADELAQHVERICAATGAQQVHVVGAFAGRAGGSLLRPAAGRGCPGAHPRHAGYPAPGHHDRVRAAHSHALPATARLRHSG